MQLKCLKLQQRLIRLALILLTSLSFAPLSTAELPILRAGIADTDYPPFYFHEAGQTKGISTDICQHLAAQLGYRIEFVAMPFSRLLYSLGHGEIDMACTLFNTSLRAPKAAYTSIPHAFETIHLIATDDFQSTESDAKLLIQQYHLGGIRNYYYGPEIENSGVNITLFNNEPQLIKNLISRRIDIAVSNDQTFAWHARQLNIPPDRWHTLGAPIYSGPIYMAFTRTREDAFKLAADFTRQLLTFRDSLEYQQILQHYRMETPKF